VGEADKLDGHARAHDGVEGEERQVDEPEHLLCGEELRDELAERRDEDHEQERVDPEDLRCRLCPVPVTDVEVVGGAASNLGEEEDVEDEEELAADEELLDVGALVCPLEAVVPERVKTAVGQGCRCTVSLQSMMGLNASGPRVCVCARQRA